MPQAVALVVRRWTLALAALAIGGGFLLPTVARGDDYLDRVNGPFRSVQPDKRSDKILIPLLAKITEPPAAVAQAYQAALLPADSVLFAAVAEWAQAEPQKAFLAALPSVTGEEDPKKAYAFGQFYGTEGVDPDQIAARAYTGLGDPPLLSMARHLYLPMLDRAESLVHVEATRLAAAGKPEEALDLLWRWVHFARSMADRQFYAEVVWAIKAMTLGLERIRDVTYVDSRLDKPLLTAEYLSREVATKRLRDRGGILAIEKMEFPAGDGIACEQLIARVFHQRGKPDRAVFSQMLARVSSHGRPLRLFSETARWDSIATLHANELETRKEMLGNVMGDWQKRWKLNSFDPALKLRYDWDKMDKIRGAIVVVTVENLKPIFALRHRLRLELAGTRLSVAAQAYALGQKNNPPVLGSLVPHYIPKAREGDNADTYSIKNEPFQYFVPVRDAVLNEINPVDHHEVLVFPGGGFPSFTKRLNQTHFVIYSIGPDGGKQSVIRATQLVEDDKGDYLMWPPVMSLLRENLQLQGVIK